MKKSGLKYFLAAVFLLALWAPSLQKGLNIFKGGELHGAYVAPQDIPFTLKDWFNGTYSENKEAYLKGSFGFQGDVIRLYNQLNFDFFNIASTENVVVGKQGYIYEQRYIDSYYGTDFVGEKNIRDKAGALKQLQDTLQQHGIFLFMVFAPGKGTFYPEYIPDNKQKAKHRTNYQACIDACRDMNINYIDFEKYFLAIKDTSRYRLYTRGGTHWSYYGDVLAFDSIMRYVKQKTTFKLPRFKMDTIVTKTKPQFRDNDAADAMNLIYASKRDTLAYPQFSATDTASNLNFMVVGDSYFWQMQIWMTPLIFKDCSFWYYFIRIYSNHRPLIEGTDAHRQLKNILLQQNIICIMETDAALSDFGFGLPEEANKKLGTK